MKKRPEFETLKADLFQPLKLDESKRLVGGLAARTVTGGPTYEGTQIVDAWRDLDGLKY